MKRQKRFSLILAVAMIFVTVLGGTSSYAGSDFVDMPNNWAKPGLEHAVKHGLLEGNAKNEIRPEDSLTREQLAAISVRLLGLKEEADLEVFKDFEDIKWSHDALSKAVAAGILKGSNGRLNPKKPATRQEVFVVMARTFVLEGSNEAVLDGFKDGKDVSNWAKEATSALVENKYIEGDNLNRLNPKKSITRAEFAKMLMEMATDFTAGSLKDKTIDGNLIANSKDIDLDGVTIKGDLILGEGVELSDINLSNTKIEGRIVVRAGKQLNLKGTEVNKIVVSDKLDDFTAELDRKSTVDSLVTESKVTIKGNGRLKEAIFKEGSDGSKIETSKTEVKLEGAESVFDKNGKEIVEDTTTQGNPIIPTPPYQEDVEDKLEKDVTDKISDLEEVGLDKKEEVKSTLVSARELLKDEKLTDDQKARLEEAIAKTSVAFYNNGDNNTPKDKLDEKIEELKLTEDDAVEKIKATILADLENNLGIKESDIKEIIVKKLVEPATRTSATENKVKYSYEIVFYEGIALEGEVEVTLVTEEEKLAEAAVEKAEESKKQKDVDAARELVNALEDGDLKTDLTSRLDSIQAEIDKLAEADILNAAVEALSNVIELEDKSVAFNDEGHSGAKDVTENDIVDAIKKVINNDEIEVEVDNFNSKKKKQSIKLSLGNNSESTDVEFTLIPNSSNDKTMKISGKSNLTFDIKALGNNSLSLEEVLKELGNNITEEQINIINTVIKDEEIDVSVLDSEMVKVIWKEVKKSEASNKLSAYRITIRDNGEKVGKIAIYENGEAVIEK